MDSVVGSSTISVLATTPYVQPKKGEKRKLSDQFGEQQVPKNSLIFDKSLKGKQHSTRGKKKGI